MNDNTIINFFHIVAYIPFPFPHSQLSALFLVIILCFLPILMISYVKVVAVGALLNIVAVGVLVGKFCLKINELQNCGIFLTKMNLQTNLIRFT